MTRCEPAVVAQRDWATFIAQPEFERASERMQGLFLKDALACLKMDPGALAQRIGVTKKCLGRWMLSVESKEFRGMPMIAWRFIAEIMERQTLSLTP